MRYFLMVSVFVSCLLLSVGQGDEVNEAVSAEPSAEAATGPEVVIRDLRKDDDDAIPEEALKIPVKERKKLAKVATAPIAKRGPEEGYSLSTKTAYPQDSLYAVTLSPMLGTTFYGGGWKEHIGNAYSLGLSLDIPVTDMISAEAEAGYGSFNVTHSGVMKDFNQYWLGAGTKFYMTRNQLLRPYIGLGLEAINYENMVTWNAKNNRWVGVSQVSAGVDFGVLENASIGVRAGWYKPLFNRPNTVDNGVVSHPAFADAAAINTDFYRLMGTVKVEL